MDSYSSDSEEIIERYNNEDEVNANIKNNTASEKIINVSEKKIKNIIKKYLEIKSKQIKIIKKLKTVSDENRALKIVNKKLASIVKSYE
jgi:hypothetical protein